MFFLNNFTKQKSIRIVFPNMSVDFIRTISKKFIPH